MCYGVDVQITEVGVWMLRSTTAPNATPQKVDRGMRGQQLDVVDPFPDERDGETLSPFGGSDAAVAGRNLRLFKV
jgi:hypothetical protein